MADENSILVIGASDATGGAIARRNSAQETLPLAAK